MHPRLSPSLLLILLFTLSLACKEDDHCEGLKAGFNYGNPVTGISTSCTWRDSSNPEAVSNPIPTLDAGAKGGIFTATPAGLVFVDNKNGEIDLAASQPGTYTVTNTLSTCGVSESSQFVMLPPEELTVEEVNFPSPSGIRHYYRFKQTETHPELKDETKYSYAWYQVLSTGVIRQITDVTTVWESVGSLSLNYYIDSDPATGSPRKDDAMVVDVTNLETGCVTRFAFGKPLSELPAPGKNL